MRRLQLSVGQDTAKIRSLLHLAPRGGPVPASPHSANFCALFLCLCSGPPISFPISLKHQTMSSDKAKQFRRSRFTTATCSTNRYYKTHTTPLTKRDRQAPILRWKNKQCAMKGATPSFTLHNHHLLFPLIKVYFSQRRLCWTDEAIVDEGVLLYRFCKIEHSRLSLESHRKWHDYEIKANLRQDLQ